MEVKTRQENVEETPVQEYAARKDEKINESKTETGSWPLADSW